MSKEALWFIDNALEHIEGDPEVKDLANAAEWCVTACDRLGSAEPADCSACLSLVVSFLVQAAGCKAAGDLDSSCVRLARSFLCQAYGIHAADMYARAS